MDAVDLYQLHAFDPLTPLEETLRTLDGFIRAGKIRYWGLSNFTGWQLTKAVHLARALNMAAPVALQPQYSLIVREIEWEIAPAAMDAGLGLLPWSPLGGGWLSGKYQRGPRPYGATRLGEDPGRDMEAYDRRGTPRTWQIIDAVQKVASERGVTMAEVALAWVTGRPAVTSAILGACTQEQLDTNLRAAGLRLFAEEVSVLDAASDPGTARLPLRQAGPGTARPPPPGRNPCPAGLGTARPGQWHVRAIPARPGGDDVEIKVVLSLPRDAASVPVSRQVLDNCLEIFGVIPDTRADIALALTEACANVILHAGPGDEYEIHASARDGRCIIDVVNAGGRPEPATRAPGARPATDAALASPPAEHGRGLKIIDAVADNLQLTGNVRNGTTVTHFEKALDYLPGAAGRLLISAERR
jgi:diketogulonate reductase-like aldo/keto reductase/anti-sigma regulatory factor (Ser/Thr protein kinase)